MIEIIIGSEEKGISINWQNYEGGEAFLTSEKRIPRIIGDIVQKVFPSPIKIVYSCLLSEESQEWAKEYVNNHNRWVELYREKAESCKNLQNSLFRNSPGRINRKLFRD